MEVEIPKVGWELRAKDLVLHCSSSFAMVTSIILDMAGEAIHHGEKRIELMAKQPVYLIQHMLESELMNLSSVSFPC